MPVVGDDWYERRRGDAAGEFFRGVADQGPRKGQGGSTRQGIYFLTAGGRLLGYKNAGQSAAVMRESFQAALRAWNKLPEDQRRPGAVSVDELSKSDARFVRQIPGGGLIVNTFTRILDRDGKGSWKEAAERVKVGGVEIAPQAQHDRLWLKESEWQALVPPSAKAGDKASVPDAIAYRIYRFHLCDGTRGEPPMWKTEEVRKAELTLTVEAADANSVRLKLSGSVLIATASDPTAADRGFDAKLLGTLVFNRTKGAFEKFDVVVLGEHWGEGTYTRGARPGRSPLGVAFELSKGDSQSDRVPPQAARDVGEYFRGK